MKQCSQRFVRFVIVLAGIVAMAAPGLWAGAEAEAPDPGYEPPVFRGEKITLLEAIRLTIEHEPNIKLQTVGLDRQKGVVQEAAGAFDAALIGSFSYEFIQSELTGKQIESELAKRNGHLEDACLAARSAAQNEALRDVLDEASVNLDGIIEETYEVDIGDAEVIPGGLCGEEEELPDPQSYNTERIYFEVQMAQLRDAIANGDTDRAATIRSGVETWLNEYRTEVNQDAADERESERESLQKYDNLGAVPDANQSYEGSLSLELRKPFRNGVVMTPYLDMSGSGVSTEGRPKDPDFGGKGIIDSYTTKVGFSIDIPLARGRGFESAGALEKAAQIDYDATVSTLTHSASIAVYQTMLAYWSAVAAAENLAVFEKSLTLQNDLVELSEALIEADEMASAEIARVKARQSEVRAQVDDGRRKLHEAKVNLATTIGLQLNEAVDAPKAADPFPAAAAVAGLDAGGLATAALKRRYDVRAAHQLEKSGKVLWKAAGIDIKPILDLSLDIFTTGYDEYSSFAQGLRGSVNGMWAGPSASIGLSYEKPINNNSQLGRLEQRKASYQERAISARDLERGIKSNVVLAVGSLKEIANQLEQNIEAAELYRKTVDAELEKLRLGDSTLIDTIQTEQRLTTSMLSLVSSKQRFAQFMTQLRFETGTLVSGQDGGGYVLQQDLLTLPTASQGGM